MPEQFWDSFIKTLHSSYWNVVFATGSALASYQSYCVTGWWLREGRVLRKNWGRAKMQHRSTAMSSIYWHESIFITSTFWQPTNWIDSQTSTILNNPDLAFTLKPIPDGLTIQNYQDWLFRMSKVYFLDGGW